MVKLKQLFDRVNNISILKSIEAAFNSSSVKTKAKDLNRSQLNEGKGAKGETLSTYKSVAPDVYALYTVTLKKMFNQPHNKVTLKDSGEFHKSFKLIPFADHAIIGADTKKSDGDMNENIDVDSTLGIMPDNMQDLIMSIIPNVRKDLRSTLKI